MGRIDLFRVTANNFWEIQANLASDQRYAKDLFAYLPEGKWPKEFGKFINFLKEQPITDGWLKSNPTCAKFSTLNQQSLVFGERVLDMGKNIRKAMIGEANPLWISRMKSGTYTITPCPACTLGTIVGRRGIRACSQQHARTFLSGKDIRQEAWAPQPGPFQKREGRSTSQGLAELNGQL